jgi:N-acetylmuramoyl-L-alanine amidase
MMYITPVGEEEIAEQIEEGEKELLACLVWAEARGEDQLGKQLVVDVVLNRVDDPRFPDTITDVIYQRYQFSPVLDGSLQKAFTEVTPECYEAVAAELEYRTDSEILYFTAGGYGRYGTRAYQWGNHFFNK